MIAAPRQPMGSAEFIVLMAMLAATVAFSIDAMLPALGDMGRELNPDAPERAGLVVTAFVAGMGLGTLFTGPLSDRFGRRPVMLWGALIYALAAAAALFVRELDALLVWRFIQGMGAAGPRIVTLAIVRDRYDGERMAQILSFIMVVFTLVPVLAPTMGAGLVALAGWRGIFGAFVGFAALSMLWFALRQPESLTADDHRPFSLRAIAAGLREMWSIPMVRLAMLVQTLGFAMLFSILSSVHQIYDQAFGAAEHFHLWFGGIALVAGTSGFLNAGLVMRFGMRAITTVMFAVSTLSSVIMTGLWLAPVGGEMLFWGFVIWQTVIFFQAGMTIGNLNALAMEPLGHIAGLAASVLGAVATIGAAILSVPISLAFDGTGLPLALSFIALAGLALTLSLKMRQLERTARDPVKAPCASQNIR